MIEEIEFKYTLVCDKCCKEEREFKTFENAVDYVEENEWVKFKTDHGWKNLCPICAVKWNEDDRPFANVDLYG